MYEVKLFMPVSIPQAVSTVATNKKVYSLYKDLIVSIPQAVSTVATCWLPKQMLVATRFNTASGKHCCNDSFGLALNFLERRFNTASGKHCCNVKQ